MPARNESALKLALAQAAAYRVDAARRELKEARASFAERAAAEDSSHYLASDSLSTFYKSVALSGSLPLPATAITRNREIVTTNLAFGHSCANVCYNN
jgi:hypothetical protein